MEKTEVDVKINNTEKSAKRREDEMVTIITVIILNVTSFLIIALSELAVCLEKLEKDTNTFLGLILILLMMTAVRIWFDSSLVFTESDLQKLFLLILVHMMIDGPMIAVLFAFDMSDVVSLATLYRINRAEIAVNFITSLASIYATMMLSTTKVDWSKLE
jgi:hypothetical protein